MFLIASELIYETGNIYVMSHRFVINFLLIYIFLHLATAIIPLM